MQSVGAPKNLIIIGCFVLALLCSIIPHEIAHGFIALKNGDDTAKKMGRLSPNPAKHFDPIGFLSFCLVGFGWAKPVPVNPFRYRNFRRGNFWVSIAGIVTNLIISFVLCLFMTILFLSKVDNIVAFTIYWFLYLTITINLSLAVFNLLPVYPLDGFNILVSLTKPNNGYMTFVRQNSMFVLIIVILLMYWLNFFQIAVGATYDFFMWFWDTAIFWA
jgi:Zn-dependent protease